MSGVIVGLATMLADLNHPNLVGKCPIDVRAGPVDLDALRESVSATSASNGNGGTSIIARGTIATRRGTVEYLASFVPAQSRLPDRLLLLLLGREQLRLLERVAVDVVHKSAGEFVNGGYGCTGARARMLSLLTNYSSPG